jgi:hypothetical protein
LSPLANASAALDGLAAEQVMLALALVDVALMISG